MRKEAKSVQTRTAFKHVRKSDFKKCDHSLFKITTIKLIANFNLPVILLPIIFLFVFGLITTMDVIYVCDDAKNFVCCVRFLRTKSLQNFVVAQSHTYAQKEKKKESEVVQMVSVFIME